MKKLDEEGMDGYRRYCIIFCIALLLVNTLCAQTKSSSDFASTFIINQNEEEMFLGASLVVDQENNILVVGETKSESFTITKGLLSDCLRGDKDIFIMRVEQDLSKIHSATIFGGKGIDRLGAVTIDSKGNLYITGTTTSIDFLDNPKMFCPIGDSTSRYIFITKISPDLSKVTASAIISVESGGRVGSSAIYFDEGRNRIIIGGSTGSETFPITQEAYQRKFAGGGDKFIAVMNSDLKDIIAATYVGGSGRDGMVNGLIVDSTGNIFIGGSTFSADYPTTPNGFKAKSNEAGVYGCISKFSSDLTTLLGSTFIGEAGNDFVYGIDIDKNENVIFTGHVHDLMPTTKGAYKNINSGHPDVANVGILSNDLSTLIASTFIVGGGEGSWWGGYTYFGPIKVSTEASIYVMGTSQVQYYPTTPGAFDDTFNGKKDIVVCKLNSDLSVIEASTFIGGANNEYFGDMILNKSQYVFASGSTLSPEFPITEGSFNTSFDGVQAIFLTRFDSNLAEPTSSPIHLAAAKGNLKDIEHCVSLDAKSISSTDKYLRTALHWACRYGYTHIAEWLFSRGAKPNVKDEEGNVPLHLAALYDHPETVALILSLGADKNVQNNDGDTPLHLAAHIGGLGVMEMLLNSKAEVNLVNSKGNTPLHRAVFSRQKGAVGMLLKNNADFNLQNNEGETPLHLSCIVFKNEEIVDLLLYAKPDVNIVNANNETALHYVVGYGWEPSIFSLLKQRPDLNVISKDGDTPLLLAVERGLTNVVKMMVSLGVDTGILNKEGKSAIDIAKEKELNDIVDLLD